MEPIRHTLTTQIPVLRMYREDLDEFLSFFEKAGAKVTISDNQYRFDSLDDMKAHKGSRILNIDIQAEHPAVHFTLNQSKMIQGSPSTALVYFNELRTEEISNEADNLFYRLREFLLLHKAPRFHVWLLIPAILAALACVALAGFEYQIFKSGRVPVEFVACLVASVGFLIASGQRGNELILETRSNSPTFLKTNRNSIIMVFVGTGIGIIGTLASQWLSRLLFK